MKTSKAEMLNAIIQQRKEIIESIACLPDEKQVEAFLGEWSLKDLLAHLIGWDHANLEAIQALREQRLPGFYAFYDKDWRRYNAQWVERYRDETFAALLKKEVASHRVLLEALAKVPEVEFRQDRGVRFKGVRVTLGRLLEAETRDEGVHFKQVLGFLEPARRAESLFLGGYNCSQSVLQAFAPRLSLAQEAAAGIATAFGAGISFQGLQCGAVSGALMVIGLKYGNRNNEDKAAKVLTYTRAREFSERFRERHQSLLCRDLLGIDMSQPGEHERAQGLGVFEQICPGIVHEAVEILSAMMEEE